jgi:hypothetical protein
MAINNGHPKMPGSQGFKCNEGSRLPHLPDGDRAATSSSPTPSSLPPLSRSLPSPTPTSRGEFRGGGKNREVAIGNCLMR